MAALTGTLAADFSSFQAAVAQAQVSLKGFETNAGRVESSLSRMTDTFSGRKVIQEATLMAEVFTRAGGAATFTAQELATMGAVGAEAIEKLHATGEKIPPNLQAMAAAANQTTPAVLDMHGAFQSFDSVLASVGIHIGPEIKALGELGAVSGKTAASIGLLGTAGLALGAGLGGWKIGRLIADFTGSDKAIGDSLAKLLGWGDVADQVAGAKADAAAAAVRRQSGAFDDHRTAAQKSAQELANWQAEIDKVKASGNLESLTKDLASQNFPLKELAERYHLSAEALQFLTRQQAAAAEDFKNFVAIEEAGASALKKSQEELAKVTEAVHKRMFDSSNKLTVQMVADQNKILAVTNAAVAAEFAAQVQINKAWGVDAAGALTTQATAAETLRIKLEALHLTKVEGISQQAQEQVLVDAYTQALYDEAVALDAVIAKQAAANDETAKVPELVQAAAAALSGPPGNPIPGTSPTGFSGTSAWAATEMTGHGTPYASFEDWARAHSGPTNYGLPGMPGYAEGGPVLQDGPIYAHAGEYVIPSGGSAVTVNNVFNMVDTESGLTRRVSENIQRSIRQGLKVGLV